MLLIPLSRFYIIAFKKDVLSLHHSLKPDVDMLV